jgi:ribonuclease T2
MMIGICARAVAASAFTLALLAHFSSAQESDSFYRDYRERNVSHQRGAYRGIPGQFDFYVLSLSWSPSFCETGARRDGNDQQCGRGRPYAFVVHGLWPQYNRGFPKNCMRKAPWIESHLINSMLDLMPARQLVIHEWQEHGTCSGIEADKYFAAVRSAREHVNIPDRFSRVDHYIMVSPDEIEEAFIAANPGLTRDMIVVTCDNRRLREVRICFSKNLEFRSCPETDRRGCRNPRVVMPPTRGE